MHKIIIKLVLALIVIGFFYLFLAIYWTGYQENQLGPADAAVVLGAAQYDGIPSPIFAARLDQAKLLYDQDLVKKVVVTGGKGGESDISSEGRSGRDYLVQNQVPDNVVFFEEESRTTWENISELKKILEQEEIDSVIFVSDRFHMFRISQMAKKAKIDFQLSPTKTSPVEKNKTEELKFVWREIQLIISFFVLGV